MIDSAVSQNNQTNWHIGIVDGSESTDFEIVYRSGDADFLAFLVSKNGIINTRVVIQPDHPAAVACIGSFKEQVIVGADLGIPVIISLALLPFVTSRTVALLIEILLPPFLFCCHCVFFIVFADSTKARYRRYRAKALSGGSSPSALPTEDNEELIAPLTVFTPSLSCWHPVKAIAATSKILFISFPIGQYITKMA
jgi:hypothetical protein